MTGEPEPRAIAPSDLAFYADLADEAIAIKQATVPIQSEHLRALVGRIASARAVYAEWCRTLSRAAAEDDRHDSGLDLLARLDDLLGADA